MAAPYFARVDRRSADLDSVVSGRPHHRRAAARIEGKLPLRLGNPPDPLPLSVGRALAAGGDLRATALRSDVAVGSHARVAADLAAGPQVSGSG